VPDPRVTNPELFDLRKPDAPMPQFVNAMRMAGIEIMAEQVAQEITLILSCYLPTWASQWLMEVNQKLCDSCRIDREQPNHYAV
jgi:hypothetical protein